MSSNLKTEIKTSLRETTMSHCKTVCRIANSTLRRKYRIFGGNTQYYRHHLTWRTYCISLIPLGIWIQGITRGLKMASQEESSRSDSSSPEALLYKLCRRLLGKETDSKGMMIIMRRKQFIETCHYWLRADIVVFGIKVQFNFYLLWLWRSLF